MSGNGPTVVSAVVKPVVGAAMALVIFLLGSVLFLLVVVCVGTIAAFIAAPGLAGAAAAFILGSIALIIFVVEFVVGMLLTVFIGLPLGALSAVFIRRSTPLAAQLALFFVVGVLSAVALAVVYALGSDTAENAMRAILDGLVSPISLALAVVTGLCAAAGWLGSTAVFWRRETRVSNTLRNARTVSAR